MRSNPKRNGFLLLCIAPAVILFTIFMGVVTAFLPFLLYTIGLRKVEASKAAILATVEPMVATIIGVVCFKEVLTVWGVVGILCIFGALLNAE